MSPDAPPWLVRWQQAEDDELLYSDQTLPVVRGDACDAWDSLARRLAMPPEEEDPDEP